MKTLNALDRFASINKSFSKDLSINQYPSNADTPWGRGYTVYGGQTIKGEQVHGQEARMIDD